MNHHAWIGLGANLGDPREQVETALKLVAEVRGVTLCARSALWSSAPMDSSGDDYVNAVAHLQTSLSPHALLAALQAIEADFGRQRPYRNAPRTLDLDLLLFDDLRIVDADLVVPHPRMHQRAFVILPLLEISPDAVIPGVGPAHELTGGLAQQVLHKIDPDPPA